MLLKHNKALEKFLFRPTRKFGQFSKQPESAGMLMFAWCPSFDRGSRDHRDHRGHAHLREHHFEDSITFHTLEFKADLKKSFLERNKKSFFFSKNLLQFFISACLLMLGWTLGQFFFKAWQMSSFFEARALLKLECTTTVASETVRERLRQTIWQNELSGLKENYTR